MLTYSLSFNKLISIPPLKKIVSSKIVEFLWNATLFMPEVSGGVSICENYAHLQLWGILWDDALTKHREQTISASNAFTEENNLPSVFKTVFKENVYLLCRAYWQVLQWKAMYDPFEIIEDVKPILLDAPNYFTADGEFDELAWTKRVVLDPIYPIESRFELACFYCLENESAVLWSELKNNDLEYLNDLRDIQYGNDPIVTIRIFQLENDFESLAQIPQFAGGVYEVGFREAGNSGNEYAIRYFWKKMAEPEKIMENEDFFDLICYYSEKVGVFIYSHLSEKQKQKYLDWSIETGSFECWGVLLLSLYTEAERSEIIELFYKLPIDQYSSVLADIAEDREKHVFPFHREEVFKVLWTHLSPEKRGQVLENCPYIIKKLINSSQFDILDYIMKGLSLEQKEKYFSANPLVAEMLKSGTG